MKISVRVAILIFCFLIAGFFMLSCGKPKEGKVNVVKEATEFEVLQDNETSWTLEVKGKVKNVGDVDVKNVVVTAYCRSCQEAILRGKWFVSDISKTDAQKDTISYLTAGAEEEFNVKEVAFFFSPPNQRPDVMPEKIDMVIESFEVAE